MDTMSEGQPPMPEIPRIPRGRLRASMLAPPLSTALSSSLLLALGNARAISPVLNWLPAALGLLSLAVFIVCLIRFILLIHRRYATSTVVLLAFGYVIGQGVVSFAILFGSCVLLMRI
jgi:hypothetical protein